MRDRSGAFETKTGAEWTVEYVQAYLDVKAEPRVPQ